jgi:hypothetical protein
VARTIGFGREPVGPARIEARPMNEDIPGELRALIATLDDELEVIGTAHPCSLEAEPTPERIYHYTVDAGFHGILEYGNLWCTDPTYLNDPSEIKYGVSMAADMLAGYAMSAPTEVQIFAHDFRRYETHVENVAHFFVLSFSTKGNDLEQWRGYANNGRGYAIGFDGKMLEAAFTRLDGNLIPEHMTFPVSYDEAKLQNIYRQLIAKVIPLISTPASMGLSNTVVEAYMQELRTSLALQVIRTALFFKHPAYINEQEYRFMQVHPINRPQPIVKFRSRPNMLLRYREFDWKTTAPDAFREIVIGPGTEPRIGGRFVDDCLRAYFPMATPHLRASGIPYRPS